MPNPFAARAARCCTSCPRGTSWALAEQALDLASVYATERVQFGQPIASYQGVAFPLADTCAELQALYELALDTLHRVYVAPEAALVDALALRWAALDIVRPC